MEENKAAENQHKAVQCENGHWFDSMRYEKCPHCGAPKASEQIESQGTTGRTGKLGGIFRWRHKKPEEGPAVSQETIVKAPQVHEEKSEQAAPKREQNEAGGGKTRSVFKDERDVPEKEGEDPIWKDDHAQKENKPRKEERAEYRDAVSEAETQVLQDMVHQASANETGKTMGYFYKKTGAKKLAPIDPVVGWLVCVQGPHIGAAYALHAGKNALGRSVENQVVLDRDESVSRQCHATVIYEPKKREFYIQAGDSSGLTYYQDDLLLAVSKMEPRSVVGIGETQLMLVPLCGPEFNWEERLEKKEQST